MKITQILSVGMACLLTACSGGEPSEQEIFDAAQMQLENTLSGVAEGMITIHAVKKLGCSKADNGYNCDIESDVERPFVGRQKATTQIRLINSDDGWVIVQ